MLVCSLGSGSSGNATLVRGASGRAVLIDCGVPYPRLVRQLARLGCTPADLDAVILTHEHGDHTRAVADLRTLWHRPIYAAPEFAALAPWLAPFITDAFPVAEPWRIGDLTFTPHAVAHDAEATYGFTISADGCTVALFTDLGHATEGVVRAIAGADLIVIEANYDGAMLDAGTYPWYLKRRIASRSGHLSNADCGETLVRAFTTDRPRTIWLAHLSANNNTPDCAVATVSAALAAAGIRHARVIALPRTAIGPIWEHMRHQQRSLFD